MSTHPVSPRAQMLAFAALAAAIAFPELTRGQALTTPRPVPNLEGNVERPVRYRPDDGDFVIRNGPEFFNRPLYGRNSAFRVDAGDKPEFVMYLPGRGGNLRLGLSRDGQTKWLHDAEEIIARYRPGEMLYEVRDPILGVGSNLELQLLAFHQTDGLVLQIDYRSEGSTLRPELIVAFGGVNGERGVRDGDIGTERVPIGEWFQLKPGFARGNLLTLHDHYFELHSPIARIAGTFPAGARLSIASADHWNRLRDLLASAGQTTDAPVLLARFPISAGKPAYLSLQRIAGVAAEQAELDTYRDVTATAPAAAPTTDEFAERYPVELLPQRFADTRAHFHALRTRVRTNTPDPHLDAAVGVLNVAADAVWDESQRVVMHGAIAWRARLLGWRGAYAMDALGWHDRAREHLEYWATRQNVSEIPKDLPPAEPATNLARNPAALHSNGDISNSHYDMNLVYIDALFRHLLWTGDRKLAADMWPLLQRHIAWERRLFRREFGPEKLPLYEAYAAIWASDDLQYHGGGVTHATAYNWWHNEMAARVALLLGADATPYEREAALIKRGMEKFLWLPELGMFAEYRDYLGRQLAHPAAALWSFYHVLDAHGLVDARRAWQMSRYVDRAIPHLPVRGPGVEGGPYHVLATSNWLPYTWSINNVVMGENMHAALGYWQAGRAEEAYTLFRSATLASMFMGISPGNVGTMNYLDVYRRESQRDFADGAGVNSRALVEGMFGVKPDALEGLITFQPGWPSAWAHASLHSPTVGIGFSRTGGTDRYDIAVSSSAFRHGAMRLRMAHENARVELNGDVLPSRVSTDLLGRRWLDFRWVLSQRDQLRVKWQGSSRALTLAELDERGGANFPPVLSDSESGAARSRVDIRDASFVNVDLTKYFNDSITRIFAAGKYLSPRSPFASLAMPSQGIGAWAGHVNATAEIDDSGLRRLAAGNGGIFTLPNNVPFAIPAAEDAHNVVFTSQWDNYPKSVTVPLDGRASAVFLLMAGSTNHMQSRFDNAEVVVEYRDGKVTRLGLRNPTNWWPIEQDYFIDDFQFRRPEPIPLRVDLKTGSVRSLDARSFAGSGSRIPGGAATVLEMALDPARELRSIAVTTLANEVVVGLMAVTLVVPRSTGG